MNTMIITLVVTPLAVLISTPALAVVPEFIPLQGILTNDEGATIDGSVNLAFTLWDAEEGGTALWTETHNGEDQVEIDDGFFTVYLGRLTPLDFSMLVSHEELWLGMSVDGDDELSRTQWAAVPFAQQALVCQQVGGLTENDIVSQSSPAGQLGDSDIANWNIAFGWGNHAEMNYLTAYLETDPVFGLSPAGAITGEEVTNWNAAHAWGNHADLYSLEDHDHDNDYVNTGGDTMVGDLSLEADLHCDGCISEDDLAGGVVTEAKLGFDPATQDELREWRLDETTGGLISNQYYISSADTDYHEIPDTGTVSISLSVEDLGVMLSSGVQLTLRHGWVDTLNISLTFTPTDPTVPPTTIMLAEAEPGGSCSGFCEVPADCDLPEEPCIEHSYDWPDIDTVISGSFDDLVGLDPSGNWELTVTDNCESWAGACTDGTQYVTEFRVNYELLSNDRSTVHGSLTINSDLSVSNKLKTSSLDVTGDVVAGGPLTVNGESYFNQTTTFVGEVEMNNTVNVRNELNVDGTANIYGNANIGADQSAQLDVYATATFHGDVTLAGDVNYVATDLECEADAGCVGTEDLEANSVTSAEIAAGAVTNQKLGLTLTQWEANCAAQDVASDEIQVPGAKFCFLSGMWRNGMGICFSSPPSASGDSDNYWTLGCGWAESLICYFYCVQ